MKSTFSELGVKKNQQATFLILKIFKRRAVIFPDTFKTLHPRLFCIVLFESFKLFVPLKFPSGQVANTAGKNSFVGNFY